jgi:putative transcriptional regulator
VKDLSSEKGPELAGSLLVAHPSMQDPNFSRTVILVPVHSREEGALGVVVNRPSSQTLGELDENFRFSRLAGVPVFKGGPVALDRLILAGWKWSADAERFNLFFGIDEEKALQFAETDPDIRLRAFLGHSGWTGGQLESELAQQAWAVSPVLPELDRFGGTELWRVVARRLDPRFGLLAEAPDDPSAN